MHSILNINSKDFCTRECLNIINLYCIVLKRDWYIEYHVKYFTDFGAIKHV